MSGFISLFFQVLLAVCFIVGTLVVGMGGSFFLLKSICKQNDIFFIGLCIFFGLIFFTFVETLLRLKKN